MLRKLVVVSDGDIDTLHTVFVVLYGTFHYVFCCLAVLANR